MQTVITLEEMVQWLGIPLPTAKQAAIIQSPLEPMLIVAGAGAGKTTTIALRMCFLILNEYIPAPSILGLTFTRKACGELEHKLQDFLHKLAMASSYVADILQGGRPMIMTYHAYCIDLVRIYGILDGIDPHFRIMDYTQSWQCVYQFIIEHGVSIYATLSQKISSQSKWVERSPELLAKDILELKSEMSEHDVSAREITQFSQIYLDVVRGWIEQTAKQTVKDQEQQDLYAYRCILAELVSQIVSHMIENGLLDYDLIIQLASNVTKKYSLIASQEQAKFSAVFLDEYQDTGEGQRRFLTNLYTQKVEIAQNETRTHTQKSSQREHIKLVTHREGAFPLQAVGDPLQSIYGWRGASAMNLPRFAQDFGYGPALAQLTYLNRSWRNDISILDFANHIAQPLRSSTFAVPELVASPIAQHGKFRLAHFLSDAAEGDWIAQEIQQIQADNPQDSVAILVRRNADIPAISTALIKHGVEHQITSLSGLLLLPHIQEILAWLTIIDGNSNDEHFLLLAVSPHLNLGAHDLWSLAEYRKTISAEQAGAVRVGENLAEKINAAVHPPGIDLTDIVLYHDMTQSGLTAEAQRRLSEFTRVTIYARQLLSMSISAMVDYLILQLDSNNHYYYSGAYSSDSVTPCDAFMNVFHSYFQTGTHSLSSFLQYCRSAVQHDRGLEIPAQMPERAVTIMTIHAAKGLEFNHVFMAGISSRNFPSMQPVSSWIEQPTYVPALLRQDISADSSDRDAYPLISWPPGEKTEFAEELKEYKVLLRERALTEERRLWYVACTRAKNSLFLSGYSMQEPSIFLRETYEYLNDKAQAECIAIWEVNSVDNTSDSVSHLISEEAENVDSENHVFQSNIYIPNKDVFSETCPHWPRDTHTNLIPSQILGGNKIIDLQQTTASELLDLTELTVSEKHVIERLQLNSSLEFFIPEESASKSQSEQSSDEKAFISVSEAIHSTQIFDQQSSSLKSARYSASSAALLGIQFHEWVQEQQEEQFLLELDDLPGAADAQRNLQTYAPTLKRWMNTFQNSRWSHKHMIATEQPFTLFLGNRLVRGRIDAIFSENDQDIIVDWKTGKKPGDAQLDSMFMQLALYRLAWSSLKGIESKHIRAILYFVEIDTEIELEFAQDEKYLQMLRSDFAL